MRNEISIEASDSYVDIFNSFEDKFNKEKDLYNTKNGIIDIDNIINQTNILVDENFLKNTSSDSFGSIESASLKLRDWDDISSNIDMTVEAISDYSNNLVPKFETGYYDTELDREACVEGLSKVVTNAISLYTNGAGDYNSFIAIGSEEINPNSGFDNQQQIYNSLLHDSVSGMESYGTGSQNFAFDMRSSIMISASNYLTSIEDKLFARVPVPKAKVEFYADNVIKYDWAKGKSMVTTGPNARGADTPISYVQLNKDASSINTKSRPVEFHGNATGLYSDGTFIAVNTPINIFSVVQNGVSSSDTVYQAFGESDTLSDGAKLKTIYLQIAIGVSSAKHSKLHKIDISYRDDCYFTKSENISDGDERTLSMSIKDLPVIDADHIDDHKVLTTDPLGALDAGSHIALNCHLGGTLNLRTSELNVTVNNATYTIKRNDTGEVSTVAADVTLKGKIDDATTGGFDVVACEIDAQYTEENIRKSNIAIRRNKITKTARVPHGRTVIFETQALPKQRDLTDLVTTARNILGLGNLEKILTVWEDFIDNVGKAYKRDAYRNDKSAYSNFVSNFVTHNSILPAIETHDIDFNKTNIKYSRDHELTEDAFGMFKREMNSFINGLMTDSCYTSILNPGEKMRFVAVTHKSVINTILTPSLTNDTKEISLRMPGNGVVILELAKNIEIEFHGLSLDKFEKKILMAPVRAGNKGHASSFGVILDVGTYSGSYTTGDSAVSEKHIVNSRESFYITTPLACKVNLVNYNSVYTSQ